MFIARVMPSSWSFLLSSPMYPLMMSWYLSLYAFIVRYGMVPLLSEVFRARVRCRLLFCSCHLFIYLFIHLCILLLHHFGVLVEPNQYIYIYMLVGYIYIYIYIGYVVVDLHVNINFLLSVFLHYALLV